MLDGWGKLEQDYFVTRGNHDRSMTGSSYDTCTVVPNTSPTHYDCWGDVFPYPLQTLQSYEVGGLRIMGLDTTMLDAAGGTMSAAQTAVRPPPSHLRVRRDHRSRALLRHRPAHRHRTPASLPEDTRRVLPPQRPHAPEQAHLPARRQPVADRVGRVPRGGRHQGVPGRPLAGALVHGRFADRNHTVVRDLSGLTPLQP